MRFAILAAAILSLPAAAFAADPVEDAIAARQGYYKLLGANMGTLAGMAKGKIDYNAEAAQVAADNIVTLTTYNIAPLFPAGTSSDDSMNTRALPKIWQDFPGVGEKAAALGEAALAMQAAAGQGADALGGALGPLGGSCKGCHDTYRAD